MTRALASLALALMGVVAIVGNVNLPGPVLKADHNRTPHAAVTVIPDPVVTPGSVRTTDVGEICSTSTRQLRHWSRDRDNRILAEYGLPPGPHPDFEIDHLVALELGGSDDDANLWPEPRRSIEPIWSAERKDKLENRLHELICSAQISPVEAQRAISDDWTAAFVKYISGSPLAKSAVPRRPRWSTALERLERRFGW